MNVGGGVFNILHTPSAPLARSLHGLQSCWLKGGCGGVSGLAGGCRGVAMLGGDGGGGGNVAAGKQVGLARAGLIPMPGVRSYLSPPWLHTRPNRLAPSQQADTSSGGKLQSRALQRQHTKHWQTAVPARDVLLCISQATSLDWLTHKSVSPVKALQLEGTFPRMPVV
jgi:hypothetical protein